MQQYYSSYFFKLFITFNMKDGTAELMYDFVLQCTKPRPFHLQVKNCTVHINDDSVFEPEEEFQVHLGTPQGDHWSGAMIGVSDIVTVTITNDEDGKVFHGS